VYFHGQSHSRKSPSPSPSASASPSPSASASPPGLAIASWPRHRLLASPSPPGLAIAIAICICISIGIANHHRLMALPSPSEEGQFPINDTGDVIVAIDEKVDIAKIEMLDEEWTSVMVYVDNAGIYAIEKAITGKCHIIWSRSGEFTSVDECSSVRHACIVLFD
jgi:hypothetical protein